LSEGLIIFPHDKDFKFILFLFALQKEKKMFTNLGLRDEIAAKYLLINVLFYNDYLFKILLIKDFGADFDLKNHVFF